MGEPNMRGLEEAVNLILRLRISPAAKLSDWFGREQRLDAEQTLTSLLLSSLPVPGTRGEAVAAVEMKREIKSQEVKQNSHFSHRRQVLWSKKQDLQGL